MSVEARSETDRLAPRATTHVPSERPVVLSESTEPPFRTEAIHFSTTAANEFWDLTSWVRSAVTRSGVRSGQVTIHTPHTTTSIVVNEAESGFLNDFRRMIDGIVPKRAYYEHDDHDLRTENLQEDEYINGHAHCRALLVGQASVTVPVVDRNVLLGKWQRVMFVELDQARPRQAYIHVQGA